MARRRMKLEAPRQLHGSAMPPTVWLATSFDIFRLAISLMDQHKLVAPETRQSIGLA